MKTDQNQFELFHNQLGYRSRHGRKRIITRVHPEMRNVFGESVFTVMEQNAFSRHLLNVPGREEFIYNGNFNRIESDFGPWMMGDFTSVQKEGIYQAWSGNTAGPSFAIRDDVYRRIIPDLIRYYQIQSCGRDVPGWHGTCHLDDGYCPETDTYIEASGGWHDAGDFRKWLSSTSMIPVGLLIAHRKWAGSEEQLGLEPGIFLREALQGVHYFLNMQNPVTGGLYNNVGSGAHSFHDNDDNRFTDNIPRSGDERRISAKPPNSPPKFMTLYALYANALKTADAELAERCLRAALKSAAYDFAEGGRTSELEQWRAWGYLELWKFTGDEAHQKSALDSLKNLLALQVTEFIGGQSLTRGFFRAHPSDPGYHRKHSGADYPIWILGEFLDALPGHPDAPHWVAAVRMWVEDYVLVFDKRNPFGILPYAIYDRIPEDHPHCNYRQIGDSLWFRYFTADNPFGRNARASLTAAALSAAYRILGRPELLDLAYQQLDWILGCNPMMMSMVNGVGVRQPSSFSVLMGNIPGGVTMGIGGDAEDMPSYFYGAHPWLCCDEYYGYQNGHFFWAVMSLEDLGWHESRC